MHDEATLGVLVFFALATFAIGLACVIAAIGDAKKVIRRSAVTVALTGTWTAVIGGVAIGGSDVIVSIILVLLAVLCVVGYALGR